MRNVLQIRRGASLPERPTTEWLIAIVCVVHGFLVLQKLKTSRSSRRSSQKNHSRHAPRAPPGWGLALRAVGDFSSHFGRGLNPARPVLPLGVFRRFGTMACFRAAASPNEVYMIFEASVHPPAKIRQGRERLLCSLFLSGRGSGPSADGLRGRNAVPANGRD